MTKYDDPGTNNKKHGHTAEALYTKKQTLSKTCQIEKHLHNWSCGVVVITSALHAEGPQFDPGWDHSFGLVQK